MFKTKKTGQLESNLKLAAQAVTEVRQQYPCSGNAFASNSPFYRGHDGEKKFVRQANDSQCEELITWKTDANTFYKSRKDVYKYYLRHDHDHSLGKALNCEILSLLVAQKLKKKWRKCRRNSKNKL